MSDEQLEINRRLIELVPHKDKYVCTIKEIIQEIERLNKENTILRQNSQYLVKQKDELEKELIDCIKEVKLKWGNQLTDKGYLDIQMTVKNYEDILNKLQELKGVDKE